MDSPPGRDWLSIITNLGVIAGLVLVAMQMRQTNEALELQSLEARISAIGVPTEIWSDWQSDIITSDEVARIWRTGNAGEELSPNETVRYNAMATRYYFNNFLEGGASEHGSARLPPPDAAEDLRLRVLKPGALLQAPGAGSPAQRGADVADGKAGARLQDHRRLQEGQRRSNPAGVPGVRDAVS